MNFKIQFRLGQPQQVVIFRFFRFFQTREVCYKMQLICTKQVINPRTILPSNKKKKILYYPQLCIHWQIRNFYEKFLIIQTFSRRHFTRHISLLKRMRKVQDTQKVQNNRFFVTKHTSDLSQTPPAKFKMLQNPTKQITLRLQIKTRIFISIDLQLDFEVQPVSSNTPNPPSIAPMDLSFYGYDKPQIKQHQKNHSNFNSYILANQSVSLEISTTSSFEVKFTANIPPQTTSIVFQNCQNYRLFSANHY
eukprot:TRINITY_DN5673_c3_g1_i2.p1 TRINITY_DN5673_c3_g1~~TRINITY_DN5673_c3_g1_i2.p1  ORF type:complete len:249 (+),score=-3.59 TRINITY_DN5673_c3_g1_i2:191-937(+)